MSLASGLKAFLDSKISYHETKKSYVTKCVKCGKDDHFYIRKDNGSSICFKCGARFSWRGLVSAIAGVSFDQAHEIIYGEGGGEFVGQSIDPDIFTRKERRIETVDSPISMGLDFFSVRHSFAGLEYLLSRGVERPDLILSYDIQFHSAMNAVVFPIKKGGETYGWQARKINPKEGELRLISSVFNKSRFLLNWDRAVKNDKIILVEGPFDCLHVDIPGFGSVASLGKGVSLEQIKMILSSPAKDIYIGLDPDASREFYEIVGRLGLLKRCFLMTPPAHRSDFGESNVEEVRESVRSALLVSGRADVLSVYFK